MPDKKPGLYIVFGDVTVEWEGFVENVFVEVENEKGESVDLGPDHSWKKREDGLMEFGPFEKAPSESQKGDVTLQSIFGGFPISERKQIEYLYNTNPTIKVCIDLGAAHQHGFIKILTDALIHTAAMVELLQQQNKTLAENHMRPLTIVGTIQSDVNSDTLQETKIKGIIQVDLPDDVKVKSPQSLVFECPGLEEKIQFHSHQQFQNWLWAESSKLEIDIRDSIFRAFSKGLSVILIPVKD
jgi:hypothetical protein